MDDESRILIEQMLAEEEYYYGRDTLSTLPSATKSKTTGKRKKRTKDMQSPAKKLKSEGLALNHFTYCTLIDHDYFPGSTVSSAALPSHKTRWTESEDSLLRAAIDEYGYGNWKKIAAHVKTRNPLQCKNRARHWVLTEKVGYSYHIVNISSFDLNIQFVSSKSNLFPLQKPREPPSPTTTNR